MRARRSGSARAASSGGAASRSWDGSREDSAIARAIACVYVTVTAAGAIARAIADAVASAPALAYVTVTAAGAAAIIAATAVARANAIALAYVAGLTADARALAVATVFANVTVTEPSGMTLRILTFWAIGCTVVVGLNYALHAAEAFAAGWSEARLERRRRERMRHA